MELGLSAVSTPATLQSARVRGYERSSKDSATISPENPSEAIRTLLAIIVEHAGGDFVGIQDALAEYGLPAYVLFNHPKHRSTLGAAMSTSAQKRPRRVRQKIQQASSIKVKNLSCSSKSGDKLVRVDSARSAEASERVTSNFAYEELAL